MKRIAVLALVSSAAAGPSSALAQSHLENKGQTKMLEEFERQESAGASPAQATPSPNRASFPAKVFEAAKPKNTYLISEVRTTRFLFLKIGDSLLRFHVDANLGDDDLEHIVTGLASSCLKLGPKDGSCASATQNITWIDRAFFDDAKLSQTASFSRAQKPINQNWKLICSSSADDCFDPIKKPHAFRLTTNRLLANGRILAHGFESQAVKATVKKRVSPGAKAEGKTFDRVYLTRTTNEKIKTLPAGTL